NNGNFTIESGRNFTTAGNFTNNGVLTIGNAVKFDVNGNLTNFSSGTLTGGVYGVIGTLQFNNANIVTNAATISLAGGGAKITDQLGHNALANFANNASTGKFTLTGGQNLTTSGGSFTNNNLFTVAAGSIFTVGNGGVTGTPVNFTQAAGTTEVDGTLTSTTSTVTPTLTVSGGTLDGAGKLTYTVVDSGTLAPGDSATKTAALQVNGPYSQTSAGAFNVSIGGNTAGAQYDQLNVSSTAGVNGFVPAVGSTFTILNASSLSGTFSTVTGTSINSSEHFTVTYNGNDVVLTVVAGPGGTPAAQHLWASVGSGTATYQQPLMNASLGSSANNSFQAPTASYNGYRSPAAPFAKAPVTSRAYQPVTTPTAFAPVSSNVYRPAATSFASVPARPAMASVPMGVAEQPSMVSLAKAALRARNTFGLPNRNRLEYGLNLLSLFGTNPKNIMKGFLNPSSQNALGYVSFNGAH
ncbi:MAG: hypothetical protein WB992_19195, partial [Bryobacteraceae bacterium]